jgi:hypothetical protein
VALRRRCERLCESIIEYKPCCSEGARGEQSGDEWGETASRPPIAFAILPVIAYRRPSRLRQRGY